MAVYTPLSENEIAAFLARYDAGELVLFREISEGTENTNYFIQTSIRTYILTVFEQRVQEEELPFFMAFTRWLSERGIACPNPILGRDGEMIYHLQNKPAALIEFLFGLGNPKITEAHAAQVGTLCANMHVAAKNFPRGRKNPLSVGGWNNLFKKFESRADEIAPGLADEIGAELAFLRAHWPCDLPMGVVHTDLFPDNIFFKNDTLSGVIDFYFACTDMLAYDLIIAMNAWCFDEKFAFVPARAAALLDAYQSVRELTPEEIEMLPILARGAAMRFLVTRCYDFLNVPKDALLTPKNPLEYLAKLHFYQTVKIADIYGITV